MDYVVRPEPLAVAPSEHAADRGQGGLSKRLADLRRASARPAERGGQAMTYKLQ
jgi:hypothetical protein